MFENYLTQNEEIYLTRYIASWRREGGKIYPGGLFEQWLREEHHLTDKEISDVFMLATNGKLELESSAKKFLEEHSDESREERRMANVGGPCGEGTGKHINNVRRHYNKIKGITEKLFQVT